MKNVLLILVITVLIILSGLILWLRYGVDQGHIQSILADALGPDYNVEIYNIVKAKIHDLSRGQLMIRIQQKGKPKNTGKPNR